MRGMALLFGSESHGQATRMIPNGGLGGLVTPELESMEHASNGTETKPVRKIRCRPPPLRISSGCGSYMALPAQSSATSSLGLGGLWPPRTPPDRRKCSLLESDDGVGTSANASPTTSRYGSALPSNYDLLASTPETPIGPKPPLLLAELPNSLLLASQGFPQLLPISPPPSLRQLRTNTEDSFTSSVPSLSPSVSTEAGTMEALRNLTTRKHDRANRDMPATYTIGSRAPVITKPLAVMTVEELLDNLAGCDSKTIIEQWLPAMRMQLENMIKVLSDAGNLQIERSINQVSLSNVNNTTTMILYRL